MIKTLYFCEKCRKNIENVSDIHFVEENSDRGFCSEECILEFYRPFMQEFENEERAIRKELQINTEPSFNEILGNDKFLKETLNSPGQRWQIDNELNQKFYTHISEYSIEGEKIYFILICSYIDGGPSFVYYRTATKDAELVKRYQRETQVEIEIVKDNVYDIGGDDIEVAPEIIEAMENKKSSILATMMENRCESDIGIEEFMKYDSYLEETLDSPDEVYEYEDEEGDTLNNFIKSFKVENLSFFYIVIVYPYSIQKSKEVAALPILSFPSVDQKLYPKYAVGKNLNERLNN